MNNYNIGDYGDFETGLASIKSLNDKLDTCKNNIADLKEKLNSDSVFMGPICDNCLENFTNVDKGIDVLTENFSKLGNFCFIISSIVKTEIIDLSSASFFLIFLFHFPLYVPNIPKKTFS